MAEPCIYKDQINKLVDSVPRLEEKINSLVGSVSAHTQIISNFIEFQARHNGEEKGKKELEARLLIAKELEATQERDKKQLRFWKIMAIIAAAGISLTAYFGFRTNKEVNTIEPTIKKEIRMQEGISKVTRGGYVKYNDSGLSDSIKVK